MTEPVISTAEAKQDKLFYVVANVVITNPDNRTCLLLKRSETEKVLGGKWAFPGGKLEHKDVFSLLVENGQAAIDGIDNILGRLAAREAQEECGLAIEAATAAIIKNKVFVRPDGVPVFMTTLVTIYKGGEVKLEAGAFTDFAWVGKDQLAGYDCIEGVRQEAELAISL